MNGLENKYIIKNNKRLRYGYTTGSCAAGAARGAVRMLLSGESFSEVTLNTPKGITLTLALHDITRGEDYVSCAVQKDAGDDPDTTNGILVYVKAEKFFSGYQTGAFPEGGRGCHQSGAQSHDFKRSRRGSPGI